MADYELGGLQELKTTLDSLGKLGRKIVSRALRDGAKVSQRAMMADAPVASGTTRRNIKVRAAKAKKNSVTINVGLSWKWWQGDTWYAAAVEYGHHAGKRTIHNAKKQAAYEAISGKKRPWIPGTHWMETSFAKSAPTAAATVKEKMVEYLEAAVAEARTGKSQ